ncbi:MAG: hypothetical protein KAX63_05820 [Pseudomonas sp.]|nr:hypothetical protein [Pseudomonas sp.]
MKAVALLGQRMTWSALALALMLSGCQTTGTTSANQAPVDPRLANSSSAKFFSKSGWQACAGGALVGALACQLGNPSEKTQCMIAAGLVGCGVGMGANYYLDNQRSQYANAEDRLDATIADVRKDNQELQMLSDTARTVIADDKRKIEQIKRDIASNKVQREQAQKQIATIDANTAYLKKSLADVRTKQQEWTKVAAAERNSGARTDTLDAEIGKMQKQVAQLESEIDQLYRQRSSIQLG